MSAAMWDSHFRVGGAYGANLGLTECPMSTTPLRQQCKAASLLLHVTRTASAYLENVWAWTADHYIDTNINPKAQETARLSVFAARGILIESQGPTWIYGSASEHNTLYQYNIYNARDLFMGHIQTETPYFQESPGALQPFSPGLFSGDPLFADCRPNTRCEEAWGLRVIESSDIFLYGVGLYTFFQNYDEQCHGRIDKESLGNDAALEECQARVFQTSYTSGLWVYNIFTKGITEMVSPLGGIPPLLYNDTKPQ